MVTTREKRKCGFLSFPPKAIWESSTITNLLQSKRQCSGVQSCPYKSSGPAAQRQEGTFLTEQLQQASSKQSRVQHCPGCVFSLRWEANKDKSSLRGSRGCFLDLRAIFVQHNNVVFFFLKKGSWVQTSSVKPWLNLKTKQDKWTPVPQE